MKDGGEEKPRGAGTPLLAGRNVTNQHQSLRTPKLTLSLIFPRESRRGWWPETRPQLALSLLSWWRPRSPGGRRPSGIALVAASGHVGGVTAALTGDGFEGGADPPPRGWSTCWKWAGLLALGVGGAQDAVAISLFFRFDDLCVFSPSVPPAFIHSFIRNVRILSPFHLTELLFYKLCFEKTCWGTVCF